MSAFLCPHCERPAASLEAVFTGAELLAALVERAASAGLSFEPEQWSGDSLAYTLACGLCGEQSLHSTERLLPREDPEPIG